MAGAAKIREKKVRMGDKPLHVLSTGETKDYDYWRFACNKIRHEFCNLKILWLAFEDKFWQKHSLIWNNEKYTLERKVVEMYFEEQRLRQIARTYLNLERIKIDRYESGSVTKGSLGQTSKMLLLMEQIAERCISRNYISYGREKIEQELRGETSKVDDDDPGGKKRLREHYNKELEALKSAGKFVVNKTATKSSKV